MKARLVETKTASSAATIPLPMVVVERLRSHLARLDAERPIVPIGDSLVFVTERGLAVNGSWLTKHFQALLDRAGLPRMRLHDLRHGAVSLLVDGGAHPESLRSCSDTRPAAESRWSDTPTSLPPISGTPQTSSTSRSPQIL